jgi:putative Holliday junction resolvase
MLPNAPAFTCLAFDFGSRRIGVAVGNTWSRQAQGVRTIDAARNDLRWRAIEGLFREWQPDLLVVGRPVHPDGSVHAQTHRCERFARQLGGRFGREVRLIDERYTSAVAADEGAADIDQRAAEQILQSYFDSLPRVAVADEPGADS